MKEKCAFRMYAGIKFNREIDLEKDFISPGGYNFTMNGDVQFDFESCSKEVDSKDKTILHIECRNPDWAYIGQNITENMLRKVTDINEFFVYVGEPGETNLKPIGLTYVEFELVYKGREIISVDYNVVKSASIEM